MFVLLWERCKNRKKSTNVVALSEPASTPQQGWQRGRTSHKYTSAYLPPNLSTLHWSRTQRTTCRSWPRCTFSPPHATSAKDHLDMVTLSRSMFMEVNSVALSGVSAGSHSETEQQSCTVAVPCPHLVWRENWCREKIMTGPVIAALGVSMTGFFMTGVFMTFFWDFFTKGKVDKKNRKKTDKCQFSMYVCRPEKWNVSFFLFFSQQK